MLLTKNWGPMVGAGIQSSFFKDCLSSAGELQKVGQEELHHEREEKSNFKEVLYYFCLKNNKKKNMQLCCKLSPHSECRG